jgi:UDP-N-acetylmuramate dehydrogenase
MFEKEKNTRSREGRVPAGWLIEKAGMKGVRVGNAEASEQHPNYLVNTGGATAGQVKALAMRIKDTVEKQFGIRLQEEAAVF